MENNVLFAPSLGGVARRGEGPFWGPEAFINGHADEINLRVSQGTTPDSCVYPTGWFCHTRLFSSLFHAQPHRRIQCACCNLGAKKLSSHTYHQHPTRAFQYDSCSLFPTLSGARLGKLIYPADPAHARLGDLNVDLKSHTRRKHGHVFCCTAVSHFPCADNDGCLFNPAHFNLNFSTHQRANFLSLPCALARHGLEMKASIARLATGSR